MARCNRWNLKSTSSSPAGLPCESSPLAIRTPSLLKWLENRFEQVDKAPNGVQKPLMFAGIQNNEPSAQPSVLPQKRHTTKPARSITQEQRGFVGSSAIPRSSSRTKTVATQLGFIEKTFSRCPNGKNPPQRDSQPNPCSEQGFAVF